MSDIVANGCRISVELDPPSQRPPLLLIHALGNTSELFEPQLTAFRPALRLLRYDLRGHGRSEVPRQHCTLDDLGRDALAVLDAAGVERAHVLGVSIGGLIALWLGIHAPRRVNRLVLANTCARIATPEFWQDRIDHITTNGLGEMADVMLSRWFSESFMLEQSATALRYRETLLSASPLGYAGCCAALRDADLTARASVVRAPSLVVVGSRDMATTAADGEWLAKQIPGARVVTLDAAHLANVEQASAFNTAVLDFLA